MNKIFLRFLFLFFILYNPLTIVAEFNFSDLQSKEEKLEENDGELEDYDNSLESNENGDALEEKSKKKKRKKLYKKIAVGLGVSGLLALILKTFFWNNNNPGSSGKFSSPAKNSSLEENNPTQIPVSPSLSPRSLGAGSPPKSPAKLESEEGLEKNNEKGLLSSKEGHPSSSSISFSSEEKKPILIPGSPPASPSLSPQSLGPGSPPQSSITTESEEELEKNNEKSLLSSKEGHPSSSSISSSSEEKKPIPISELPSASPSLSPRPLGSDSSSQLLAKLERKEGDDGLEKKELKEKNERIFQVQEKVSLLHLQQIFLQKKITRLQDQVYLRHFLQGL